MTIKKSYEDYPEEAHPFKASCIINKSPTATAFRPANNEALNFQKYVCSDNDKTLVMGCELTSVCEGNDRGPGSG